MTTSIPLTLVICLLQAPATQPAASAPAVSQPAAPTTRRGAVVTTEGRPARFPHRIWAATDFEARPEGFGWFGDTEAKNIPAYPGNRTARKGTGPAGGAALKTGMNPVPGPRMGKVNKLYVRYYIDGTDAATFQYFSLSSGDNCHIRASGLRQGRWSETVLDFTHDSRRNDGSPQPFEDGERMDDFQLYAGTPGEGRKYALIIDDAIFFAEDPSLPPEPEPFPRRVMFVAGFDTGIDTRSLPKYYPGQFEVVTDDAPDGAYWGVARAVPAKDGDGKQVLLEMKPSRTAGPDTKVRFRYWLKGGEQITVSLRDESGEQILREPVQHARQGAWTTQYVTFAQDEKTPAGKRLATGTPLSTLVFTVPAKDAELYIDEVVLFDAAR